MSLGALASMGAYAARRRAELMRPTSACPLSHVMLGVLTVHMTAVAVVSNPTPLLQSIGFDVVLMAFDVLVAKAGSDDFRRLPLATRTVLGHCLRLARGLLARRADLAAWSALGVASAQRGAAARHTMTVMDGVVPTLSRMAVMTTMGTMPNVTAVSAMLFVLGVAAVRVVRVMALVLLVLFRDMTAAAALRHVVLGVLAIDVPTVLALVVRQVSAMLEVVGLRVLFLFLGRALGVVLVLGTLGPSTKRALVVPDVPAVLALLARFVSHG
jgi:hypothetical protein